MFVIKRNGRKEPVHFDKIQKRISMLAYGLDPAYIDPALLTQKVCMSVYKGVSTVELDELAAETAATMIAQHPDWGVLAARIAVSNLHKTTLKSFSASATLLYNNIEPKTKRAAPLLDQCVYDFIQDNAEELDDMIIHAKDFTYDYFGFKTLSEQKYLTRGSNNKIIERPQFLLLRAMCGIYAKNYDKLTKTGANMESIKKGYGYLSDKFYTHATPFLLNAGTRNGQLASCYLLTVEDDSIDGIFNTLKECAMISKSSGGIGAAVSNVRGANSYIAGSNGWSNGIIAMLRVFNSTARYVNQGGKRNGAFAMYLEPHHPDIMEFLELKKNHGAEEMRTRDLFTALWISDLFMKRVEADMDWSLISADVAPKLMDLYGEEYEAYYEQCERDGLATKVVKAKDVFMAMVVSQIETGMPYMLFKDAANKKNNQMNLGTLHCSNLCTEIMQYSSKEETAVCNLSSMALPRFVNQENLTFDFIKFMEVVQFVAVTLNFTIDVTFYPTKKAELSNKRHRPLGIGVQGWSDLMNMMRIVCDSKEAALLDVQISAAMYYAALTASNELARIHGPYESYEGSPISKGLLQYDLWGVKEPETINGLLDWEGLKAKIKLYGVRNSLLIAPMPTATTSQILAFTEGRDWRTSNIYTRKTLAGNFQCVNDRLVKDLIQLGLWNETMLNRIILAGGSVQTIKEIPESIRQLYKTVWDMPQKTFVDMAANSACYIDQSISMNIHIANATIKKVSALHFYTWKKGLKTGLYYLRTQSSIKPTNVTIAPSLVASEKENSNKLLLENQTQIDSTGDEESPSSISPSPTPSPTSSLRESYVSTDNLSELQMKRSLSDGSQEADDIADIKLNSKTLDEISAERKKKLDQQRLECAIDLANGNKKECAMCSS